MSRFPWGALGRALSVRERGVLGRSLSAMLRWQRDLGRWPPLAAAPNATPFVSLYARGVLKGCMGSQEGAPAERVARAFLLALGDLRMGGLAPADRDELSIELAYVTEARKIALGHARTLIAPGEDGLALVRAGAPSVLLLPEVAREERLDADGLVDALARKADVPGAALEGAGDVWAFKTESVAAHGAESSGPPSGVDAAAAWLAARVGRDGAVSFSVDARARDIQMSGPMHLGRAAVVVRALEAHGGYAHTVSRARRWLAQKLLRAGGTTPEALGELALGALAGALPSRTLVERLRGADVAAVPWHAAQVVAALGMDAPSEIWDACVRDLDARPWAPWTAIAARARGDRAALARVTRALAASIHLRGPHAGGAAVAAVPEVALTAIAAEALAGSRHGAALRAARGFLQRAQIDATRRAVLDPSLGHGAFPLSPVADSLRCDVTAHAVLALLP